MVDLMQCVLCTRRIDPTREMTWGTATVEGHTGPVCADCVGEAIPAESSSQARDAPPAEGGGKVFDLGQKRRERGGAAEVADYREALALAAQSYRAYLGWRDAAVSLLLGKLQRGEQIYPQGRTEEKLTSVAGAFFADDLSEIIESKKEDDPA